MGKKSFLSEARFFEALENAEPGLSAPLRGFFRKAAEHGIRSEFQKSLVLRFFTASGHKSSAGYIRQDGRAVVNHGLYFAAKLGNRSAGSRYLNAVAEIIGGRVKDREGEKDQGVVGPDGFNPLLRDLLDQEDKWLAAIAELVRELRHAP